jgi:hypothetical protein
MKKYFFLYLLLVGNCLFAQENTWLNKECGTPASEVDYLTTIPPLSFKAPTAGPKMIRVYIHICMNTDGTNQAMTIPQIEPEIQFTNSVYGTGQICFAIVGYDLINSTDINTNSFNLLSGVFQTYNIANAFDVFVVASIPNGLFGFAPSTPAEYMVTKSEGFGTRRTFIHEMGHALGLEHTFRGYPSEAQGCRELVNGTNSTTCGDFIPDTPADPDGLAGATSTGCTYNGVARDANNELFHPITTNYLSYWANNNCNRSTFTNGQFNRMQTTIENNATLSGFLASYSYFIVNINQSTGLYLQAAYNNISVANTVAPVIFTGATKAYFTSPRTVLNPGFRASPTINGSIVRILPSTCTF